MAFHVACPITCRRICFCPLGFPRSLQNESSRNSFFNDVCKIDEFLRDPWGARAKERNAATVQVAVPKVVPPPPPPVVVVLGDGGGGGGGGADTADDAAAAVSAQTKRAALQRKAAAAMVAAEDYARRFESGDLVDASRDVVGEEQGLSNVNVMCRICFFGENEGSERARKMLSCKSCGKKYHRSCLRTWSQHRDLFHWSLWTCPSCRICEVCRRTGDPNKFMFCKRCDGAYHCYCQHPPHKNVSSGPYVCPKHTRCHSCGSNVPGNGLSVRWFLGYTCCDACGRLFVKGNYCPVCLKVYRDSESTPMVCCDVCQRWVHCQCDGISDEKYRQFQVDNNLQYKCATCRGECYQVKDLQDAVRELWRRKDKSERDLIVSLRAAAGLPTQEEIFSISPYSDDEDNDPVMLKNEPGHSLKFSLKGLAEKSPKKTYDYGKKSSSNKKNVKKKGYQASFSSKAEPHLSFEEHNDVRSSGSNFGDDKNGDAQSHKSEEPYKFPSPIAGSLSHTEGICSINQPGVVKHKFVDEVMVNNEGNASRIVKIKSNKPHGLDRGEDTGKHASKSKTAKGNKLVILLGSRNRNATNSPRSDASSCQREQDVMTSNGSEDTSQQRTSDKLMVDRHDGPGKFDDGKGDRVDHSGQSKVLKFSRRAGNLIKLGKVRSEASDLNVKFGGHNADGYETVPPEQTQVLSGKRSSGGSISAVGPVTEVPTLRGEKVYFRRQSESRPAAYGESNDNSDAPASQSLQKDSKPSLKLKFKKPQLGTWIPHGDEEKSSNSIKGQRSKRKRPSPLMEQTSFDEDDVAQRHQDNLMDEIMDANWILKKLGKDGIGKRVEVHQQSDNSWHKGVVSDIIEGTSTISVNLEDGRVKTLELGKQGVRFVPQKKRRSKT